jgi:hypothetical protein
MTKQEREDWRDEMRYLLDKVLIAKEILANGGKDTAYKASKELEPVGFRLMELTKALNQGETK